MQRGFIRGRSMLSNVVDVDEKMQHTSLCNDGGGALFFDFAAAFPSVSHDFLRAAFRSLGWPRWLTSFIDALYWGNRCEISIGGGRQAGFSITSGIRQGCPLSPAFFAIAIAEALDSVHTHASLNSRQKRA